MKVRILLIAMILAFTVAGCASDEDKEIAREMMGRIDNIGVVTLDSAEEIFALSTDFAKLSDKQRKLVKNLDVLDECVLQLEELILEEEIKNDPTNKITEQEMAGIWNTYDGSFYFSKNGAVYYMGGKSSSRSQADFTSKYLLASTFKLGEYNRVTKVKEGEFYSSPTKELIEFTVTKDSYGNMTLNILGDNAAVGTYIKTEQVVTATDVDPQQCWHTGCTNKAAKTGDTVYCEEHSNRCLECKCYIDEDSLFCLDCIANALRNYG